MKISVSKFLFFVLTACVLLSCEQERADVSVDFIPGKPRLLQESLALADSMVVYNAQGLAYTTNSLNEIEKFAKAAVLDEKTLDYDRSLRFYEEEANLSISLFQKGKLIDYWFFYKDEFDYIDYVKGAMFSLQGGGWWKHLDTINNFFKERKISTHPMTRTASPTP